MPLWSIVLRLLLSLSLVLNGGGWAMASQHLRADAGAVGVARSSAAVMSHGVCHDHLATAGHATSGGHDHDRAKHSSSDCCKSGGCSCACVYAPATFVTAALHEVPPGHIPAASRLTPGHASPALPHLMRPPIG